MKRNVELSDWPNTERILEQVLIGMSTGSNRLCRSDSRRMPDPSSRIGQNPEPKTGPEIGRSSDHSPGFKNVWWTRFQVNFRAHTFRVFPSMFASYTYCFKRLFNLVLKCVKTNLKDKYSQTYVQQPPLGPEKVVVWQRCLIKVRFRLVFVDRWSLFRCGC